MSLRRSKLSCLEKASTFGIEYRLRFSVYEDLEDLASIGFGA